MTAPTVIVLRLAMRRSPATSANPYFGSRQAGAAMLDRLANQQLQAGFHHQAERLAHAAVQMRAGAGGRA